MYNNKKEKTSSKSSSKKASSKEKDLKVNDFIKFLEQVEKLLNIPFLGSTSNDFNKLNKVLAPIKNWNYDKFLEFLQMNLPEEKSENETSITIEDIKNIDKKEIRSLLLKRNVTKSTLEIIGYEKLGLSQSMLKAKSKEEAIKLIEAALDNLDILNAIADKAGG